MKIVCPFKEENTNYKVGDVIVRKNKHSEEEEVFMLATYRLFEQYYYSICLNNNFIAMENYKSLGKVINSIKENGDIIAHYSQDEYMIKIEKDDKYVK